MDKFKASKESNPFNIAALIDKNHAAVVTAAVDRVGLEEDPIQTFVQRNCF